MADTPAPVRLFHPRFPAGREFDPVTAVTMRHQGWTDEPSDVDEFLPPPPPDLTTPPGPGIEGSTNTNPEATDG